MKRWDQLISWLPHDRDITGVEVGVWEGRNAAALLTGLPRLTLHLIDTWRQPAEGSRYRASGVQTAIAGQSAYDTALASCMDRVRCSSSRARFMFSDGYVAARKFAPESLDFVFWDADMSGDGLAEALSAWWPTIREGGFIAGHLWRAGRDGNASETVPAFAVSRPDATLDVDGQNWRVVKGGAS